MKTGRLFVLTLLVCGLSASVQALERFEIVTTLELQELMAERDAGRLDFFLVNTLDTLIHEHHAIPGSVNIPWSRVSTAADRLGHNRDRLIITYCMGYR